MTTIIQSAERRLVHEVADDYIRQGYPVQLEPPPSELPEFLNGYRPDLIVTTPEGRIVVEVKSRSSKHVTDYYKGLQERIDAQPGWRFRLVIDDRREEELVGVELPLLTEAESGARLQASRQLADSGLFDSALVVAWSTLEGILRSLSRVEGLQLPNQGTAPLITAMYAEGNLERGDYEALLRIMRARNQAAHGFRVQSLSRDVVDQTQEIAQRLLAQERHSPQAQ